MAARFGAQLLSVVELSLALSVYDALQFFGALPESSNPLNSEEIKHSMAKAMSDPEIKDLKHRQMSLQLEKFEVMSTHNQNTSVQFRDFLSRDESSKSRSKRRRGYFDWIGADKDGNDHGSKVVGAPSEVCIEEFWRNLVFPEHNEELDSGDVITSEQIQKEKDAFQKHHKFLRPSRFKVYDDKDLQELFPKIIYAEEKSRDDGGNGEEGGKSRSPRKQDLQRAQLFASILDFLVSTTKAKDTIEAKFADHAIITAERFDQRASDLTAPFAPVQEEGGSLLRIPFTIGSFALMRYAFHKENVWQYLSLSNVKQRLPVPALMRWVLCSPIFLLALVGYLHVSDVNERNLGLRRPFTLNKVYDELLYYSKAFYHGTSYLTQEGLQAFVADVLGNNDAKKEYKGEERRYRDLVALQNLHNYGKDGEHSNDGKGKVKSEREGDSLGSKSKSSDLDFFYDTNFIRVFPGATVNDPYTLKRVQWTMEKPALDNVLYTGYVFQMLRCTPHMGLFSASVYTAFLYAIESDERQNMWTNWFERPLNSAQDFILSFLYQTSMNLAYMSTGLSLFGLIRPIIYSSLSSLYCITAEFNGRQDILHRESEYRGLQVSQMYQWRKHFMASWRDTLHHVADVYSVVSADNSASSSIKDVGTMFGHLHRDSEQTKELSFHLAAYLFWTKQLASPLQDKLRCFDDSLPANTIRKGGEQREQHERELEDSNIAIDLGRYRHSIKKDSKVQADDLLDLLNTLDHLLDISTLYYKEAELTSLSPNRRVYRFGEHTPVGQKATVMTTSLTPDLARLMVGAPVGDERCSIDEKDLRKRMIPASQMDQASRTVDEMDYRARKLMTLRVLKWYYPAGLTFEKLEKELPTLLTYYFVEKCWSEALRESGCALPNLKIFTKFLEDNRSMPTRGIPEESLKDMPYICRFLPYTFEQTNDTQSREAVLDMINNYYKNLMDAQIREAKSFARHSGKAFWNEHLLKKVDRNDFGPLKDRLQRKLDLVTKCESIDYLNNLGMTEYSFRQLVMKYNSAVGSQYFDLKNDWMGYLRSEKHYSKIYKAFIQEIMAMKPN